MSAVKSALDGIVRWVAANARVFSYLLPDALEIALYVGLAAYFMVDVVRQGVAT